MAWVSPKIYAILKSSEEGKDILEGIADKDQAEVDKEVDAFFGKGGKGEKDANAYTKAKMDDKEEENAYQSMGDEEAKNSFNKVRDKKDERQYKIGTKFSVKNPFLNITDNYEVTNIGKDYVGIVGPGGVFQRILKEDFEEQFFNKRLKKEEK